LPRPHLLLTAIFIAPIWTATPPSPVGANASALRRGPPHLAMTIRLDLSELTPTPTSLTVWLSLESLDTPSHGTFWAPVNPLTGGPQLLSSSLSTLESSTRALALAPRQIEILVEATKLFWDRSESSNWPRHKLLGFVPRGRYSLQAHVGYGRYPCGSGASITCLHQVECWSTPVVVTESAITVSQQ